MYNGFDEEIKILSECKNIQDKSLVFAIYVDFYSSMIGGLMIGYNFIISEYKKYLTATFKLAVENMDSDGLNVNYVSFFKYFFQLISNNEFSKRNPIYTALDFYEHYMMNQVVSAMPYINVIDSISMDFETKARVILILREHFNNMTYYINTLYRTEISTSRKLNETIIEISSLIPEIVSKSDGFSSFERNLKEESMRILNDKVSCGYFNLQYISDTKLRDLYNTLSDEEKELFTESLLMCIVGYSKDENTNEFSLSNMLINLKKMAINKKLNKLGYRNTRKKKKYII